MTTVQQVYEVMQRLAPPELAEHWDNPGLLVDCGGKVRRVLVTLDITPGGGGRSCGKAVHGHCGAPPGHL